MVLDQRAFKRVVKELSEYSKNKPTDYKLAYDQSDLQIIYAVLMNMDGPFSGGEYILKIKLPDDYPLRPPVISCITPNGRFRSDVNICLSISHFHSETWSPLINIEKIVYSVLSAFYDTSIQGEGSIRNLDKKIITDYALKSKDYNITHNSKIMDMINQ